MKLTIPEISWHNRDPVLSVDLQQKSSDIYRLVTSGTDSHILVSDFILHSHHCICKSNQILFFVEQFIFGDSRIYLLNVFTNPFSRHTT